MIATAAVANLLGGGEALARCRKPEIVAHAAHYVLTRPRDELSGAFCIDEDLLRRAGIQTFDHYAVDPSLTPAVDIFVP
jgi:citronellol/citronellal dehydrogenase